MARIIHFPSSARRRFVPAPVRYGVRRRSWVHANGFVVLLFLTIPAAFLYLSGAAHFARHDTLYALLLAAVWGFYFTSERWLSSRLGPLLTRAGVLLGSAGIAGFFGFVYWLVLTHP